MYGKLCTKHMRRVLNVEASFLADDKFVCGFSVESMMVIESVFFLNMQKLYFRPNEEWKKFIRTHYHERKSIFFRFDKNWETSK